MKKFINFFIDLKKIYDRICRGVDLASFSTERMCFSVILIAYGVFG